MGWVSGVWAWMETLCATRWLGVPGGFLSWGQVGVFLRMCRESA